MPPVVGVMAIGGAMAGSGLGLGAVLAATSGWGILANFGASMLLSAAASAIMGKPTGPTGIESTQVSMAAPISAREIVYGRVRKGGTIVFVDTSSKTPGKSGTAMLHIVMVMAAHRVEAIDEIYFDGELAFNADGSPAARVISGAEFAIVGGEPTTVKPPRAWVEKRLGADNQAAFVGLREWLPEKWTAAHRLRGCAAIYLRLEFNNEIFPQGVPNITCVVRGKNDVLDPRTGTRGWTENPALCLADYMSSARYGLGAVVGGDLGIRTDHLIEAANICDETVSKPGGGTENRYTCNGVVDASIAPQQVIQSMLTAMAGHVIRKSGRWSIHAGAYRAPVLTLTDDDAAGPLALVTRLSRAENFNAVRGTFVSPDNDWQPDDFPAYKSSAYIVEDSGIEQWRDIALPFTTSAYTAQRIAKIELEQARRQLSIDFPAHLSAMTASAGDTVALTRSRWGMAEKPFTVVGMRFEAGEGGIGVVPTLSLSETSPLIWDWSASEAQIYAAAPRTTLPSAWRIEEVGIQSATEEMYVTRAGDGVKTRVLIEWEESESGFVDRYILQARQGAGAWRVVAETRSNSAVHEDVAAGSWDYRLRAVSSLGAVSPWSSYSMQVYALTAPPVALENVTLQTAGGVAIIKWTLSPDLDVRYGGRIVIRHSAAANPSWASSVQIDEVTGNQTIATLPLMPGTYFVRPSDSTGQLGPVSQLRTSGAQAVAFISAGTLQADGAFSGTHSNTTVAAGQLKLAVVSGSVVPSGTYTFAAGLSFSAVKNVRLRSVIELTNEVIGDSFDGRGGLVDSWEVWDGLADADVNVELQIRTTTDNPASSPVWSAWSRLDASEIAARGIQARAILTSKNPVVQVVVSVLRVQIDEVG